MTLYLPLSSQPKKLFCSHSYSLFHVPQAGTMPKKDGKLTCPFRCSCVAFTGECQWLHLELIKEMRIFCKTLFPVVEYAYGTIPTYPSGQIGFMLCSKNPVSVLIILHLPPATHKIVVRLPMNGTGFL